MDRGRRDGRADVEPGDGHARRVLERASRRPAALVMAFAVTAAFASECWASAPEPTGGRIEIEVRDGHVWANVARVPVRDVLAQLASKVGLLVWWRGGGERECPPLRLSDVTLGEAIRRILAQEDFLLATGPTPEGGRRLQLWVSSAGAESAPHRLPAPGGEFGDPPRRPRAIRPRPDWDTLLRALPPGVEPLARSAAVADLPEDRVTALRALESAAADDSRVASLVKAVAESDGDEVVRQAAVEILGTASPN